MSEVKHEWDRFYGLQYFYPNLYTPEEAWKLKQAMVPTLWPLALDLCVAGGLGNLYISGTTGTGDRVLLVNKNGYPALELTRNMSGEFIVNNWHRQLKRRGKARYVIVSKKSSYIVKAVRPHLEPIVREIDSRRNSEMIAAARLVNEHLNEVTNNASTIGTQTLAPEHAYAALRLIFDESYNKLQVTPPVMTKLESVYADLCKRFAEKKSYAERLKDMFDHPKWVIGYSAHYTRRPLMIGTVRFTPQNISGVGSYKLDYETPLTLYRDFNDFYAKHPEDEGSLKTALMFCKVFREKLPEHVKTYDKEGFIPCNYRGVYEDVGAISFCSNFDLTMTSPHYLFLQK